MITVCVVLIVAIGILAFALISRHSNNLETEQEHHKAASSENITIETSTETSEKAEAASTKNVTEIETQTQSREAETTQSTQDNKKYFTPEGEEELPSTEAVAETPKVTTKIEIKTQSNGEEDYVYEASLQFPDDFYFFNSDSIYLSKDDLSGLTKSECDFARNEIFARHGYTFKNKDFRNYFKTFDWYDEDPNYSESRLNKYEEKNAKMILNYEKDKGWK